FSRISPGRTRAQNPSAFFLTGGTHGSAFLALVLACPRTLSGGARRMRWRWWWRRELRTGGPDPSQPSADRRRPGEPERPHRPPRPAPRRLEDPRTRGPPPSGTVDLPPAARAE